MKITFLVNIIIRDYLEENVPYVIMRVFCGLTGLLVVPIAYLTVRGAGHSIAAGLVAAFMVCYGNMLYYVVDITNLTIVQIMV